jgi:hypothetical protein
MCRSSCVGTRSVRHKRYITAVLGIVYFPVHARTSNPHAALPERALQLDGVRRNRPFQRTCLLCLKDEILKIR